VNKRDQDIHAFEEALKEREISLNEQEKRVKETIAKVSLEIEHEEEAIKKKENHF